MLNIIGYEFNQLDKDTIKMIFKHAGMEEEELYVVDFKHEEPDLDTMDAIFAVGKVAIRMVVRSLVKSGKIGQSTFVGNDMYNKEAGFLFINVGVNISEIMTSQENKDFVWEKVQSTVKYYREIFPFESFVEPLEGIDDAGEMAKLDAALVEEDIDNQDVPITVGDNVTYNVGEILQSLYDRVNITDPGLTKTLSKYEKFVLHTTTGELSVYPTSRIPADEEGFFISLKDLIVLLKFSVIINTECITLSKENAHINN